MSKAIVFFADGNEECEALLTVDILRRAGVEVTMASINGTMETTSSHGVTIKCDALAEDADYEGADIVILPGGIPGTYNLADNATVQSQCRSFAENKLLAAVCAAPTVPAGLGLLEGKRATCHPGHESRMQGAIVTGEPVTVDGNIITGRGMGATIPFAFAITERLCGAETVDKIKKAICWPY